jgi:uncharacterized protein
VKGGFKIFDTHAHLGSARHSGRRASADALLAVMDRVGIDRAVAIPFPVVDDFRTEHDEIARAVRAHPDRLVGAICLSPFVPVETFRDEVRRCAEELGFRALKLQPKYQAINPVSPRSDFFFEAALRHDLTVIAHTGDGLPLSAPSLFIAPARRFPELRIVLGHAGGSIFYLEAIVAASVCPNLTIELSSLMPHHVLDVLGHVPSDRLLIGSDLPENAEAEIGKILGLPVPEADKHNILWHTAERLFAPLKGR